MPNTEVTACRPLKVSGSYQQTLHSWWSGRTTGSPSACLQPATWAYAQAEPRPLLHNYETTNLLGTTVPVALLQRPTYQFCSLPRQCEQHAAWGGTELQATQGIAAQHGSSPKENTLSAASLRRYFRDRSLGLPSGSTASLRGVLGLRPLPLLPSTALSWAASGVPHGLGASASAMICTKDASHRARGWEVSAALHREMHGPPLIQHMCWAVKQPHRSTQNANRCEEVFNGVQRPLQLSPAQRCFSVCNP